MMSLHVAKTNDISIHAAREGGDLERKIVLDAARISIHAAREGGDFCNTDRVGPCRISIHAAREGGDPMSAAGPYRPAHFNPRRP